MKKLSLLLTAVALGIGTSFAQVTFNSVTPGQVNISTVVQIGDTHQADVDQQGIFNTSKILQKTKDNVADVLQINEKGYDVPTLSDISQTGEKNNALVEQISNATKSVTLGLMEAWINQSGNQNTAIQYQGGGKYQGKSYAFIDQSGFANFASQNQKKFGNSATILQPGWENKAEQGQDADLVDDYVGSNNTALIIQAGLGNDAFQHQVGESNTATIIQPGILNLARQNQDFLSNKNTATITQKGATNEAYQTQIGMLNEAEIDQPGNNNYFTQTQLLSSYSYAYGIQAGKDNEGSQTQSGSDNDAQMDQSGNDNDGSQIQVGYYNMAKMYQSGNDNDGSQKQTGFYNDANIDQKSNGNTAEQTQISSAPEAGNRSSEECWLNKATICQSVGEGNIAKQCQENLGLFVNEAIAKQAGAWNKSEQNQFGGGAYSMVEQTGCGNSACVNQSLLMAF